MAKHLSNTFSHSSTPSSLHVPSELAQRLVRLAPLFGITVVDLATAGVIRLYLSPGHLLRQDSLDLPLERGHLRLLMEISCRCAPWHYFQRNECCTETLSKLSDAKLRRLAELYAQSTAAHERGPRAGQEQD